MSIMVSLQPIGRGVVRRVPLWFGVRRDFLQKKVAQKFFYSEKHFYLCTVKNKNCHRSSVG